MALFDRLSIATALISHCEGCTLTPKLGVDDLWAIGFGNRWGIDGEPVEEDTDPITIGQAAALLDATLKHEILPELERLILVSLSEIQWGALLSLAYNIGCGQFERSTMLRLINQHEFALAADQFDRFVFVGSMRIKGLVARRALERGVFKGVIDPGRLSIVTVPVQQHPVFASARITNLTTDDLNARELADLRAQPAISTTDQTA